MKKGVNSIKNWDKNWYKMEKIDAKLNQLYVHIFLELNVIDTNWFFSAERGGQSDLVAPYSRNQIGLTITKIGVITVEPSYHA